MFESRVNVYRFEQVLAIYLQLLAAADMLHPFEISPPTLKLGGVNHACIDFFLSLTVKSALNDQNHDRFVSESSPFKRDLGIIRRARIIIKDARTDIVAI